MVNEEMMMTYPPLGSTWQFQHVLLVAGLNSGLEFWHADFESSCGAADSARSWRASEATAEKLEMWCQCGGQTSDG